MTCPHCGEPLVDDVKFCESCGRAIPVAPREVPGPVRYAGAAPVVDDDPDPLSMPTHRHQRPVPTQPAPAVPSSRRCSTCGGQVDADGYCGQCGLKAPSARDHFTSEPAAWVAGVCDRGIVHPGNEDAMAVHADEERAVLVVCDGVSTSDGSDVASLAAAQAALDVLIPPLPRGLGVAASADAAAAKVFTEAAAAANAAVLASASPQTPRPPSCTFVAAIVQSATIRYAGIGDSRAYWLPDHGEGRSLLTDDSVAAEFMAAGMPREQAELTPQAHAITKWLGVDSPNIVPSTGVLEVDESGWVVVCSDGLWNYASEPAELRAQIDATGSVEPLPVAQALVAWANECGGRDNITVTLARVEPKPLPGNDIREQGDPDGDRAEGESDG